MGRKMSKEVILDFWNDIILLRIICICLAILLVFLTISTGLSYKQGNSDERMARLQKMINSYIAKDEFMIASIQINKQMTVSDLERLYLQFGRQPSAQALLSQYVNEICEG